MTENELCESLQIDREQLEDWLELGLPSGDGPRGRIFEPAEVHDWLVANGLAETGAEDDLCFATQQEAASWFGVSHDTLARGWRSRGMPGDIGAYSAREICRWLAQRYGQGSAGESDTLNARRTAETRKIEADASLRELKLALEQGQFVSRERVRLLFCEIAGRCRDTMMRIPAELRPILPPEHAEQIVDEVDTKVRLALNMLVKRLHEIPQASLVDSQGNLVSEDA